MCKVGGGAPRYFDRFALVQGVTQVLSCVKLQVEDALPLDAEGVSIEACEAAATARLLHGWRCHACIALQRDTSPSLS